MIKAVLAEDMVILREALTKTLSLAPDISVVGTCDSGHAVVDCAAEAGAEIAILDVRLPGMSGFEAAQQVRDKLPG
ncbi:response regulator transcription factor [Nocardiopsis rhodophaea]|uniref:response regulator transcription factor n=1 Tax=Nocardiopsis rhodophaea TaxID=280238 RepID=UPI0031D5943A